MKTKLLTDFQTCISVPLTTKLFVCSQKYIEKVYSRVIPGKLAAAVFGLKIENKEKTKSPFSVPMHKTTFKV